MTFASLTAHPKADTPSRSRTPEGRVYHKKKKKENASSSLVPRERRPAHNIVVALQCERRPNRAARQGSHVLVLCCDREICTAPRRSTRLSSFVLEGRVGDDLLASFWMRHFDAPPHAIIEAVLRCKQSGLVYASIGGGVVQIDPAAVFQPHSRGAI